MMAPSVTRIPVVAGNWKMHLGPAEAGTFAQSLLAPLGAVPSVERILCPPSVSLPAVRAVTEGSEIRTGAQNMYFAEKGAYTGEISPLMLQGLCEYVILGHSERRAYFGESNEMVNRKARSALAHHLRPIVCVGESLEQRDAGQTAATVTEQVGASLAGLPDDQLDQVIVAYEPVWAIGTGRAATVQDASEVAALIRELLAEMFGEMAAQQVRLQYGGSVTATNAGDFAAVPDIDGALVGGASLKLDFVEIVRQTAIAKGLPA